MAAPAAIIAGSEMSENGLPIHHLKEQLLQHKDKTK